MVLSKHLLFRPLQAIFALKPLRHLLCWRVSRSVKKVAITFDDGPNDHTTPEVLAILERTGIKCTFFVLGREVLKYPAVLRRVADAGHEIGIHGFDHSADNMCAQVAKCEAALAELDVSTNLFRPALGRRGMKSLLRIRGSGYSTVLWSFDAHDSMREEGKWCGQPPDYGLIRGGEIILMHDDNTICVSELPILISRLQKQGLDPVTVSELLA